jgi:hypothetical protein
MFARRRGGRGLANAIVSSRKRNRRLAANARLSGE